MNEFVYVLRLRSVFSDMGTPVVGAFGTLDLAKTYIIHTSGLEIQWDERKSGNGKCGTIIGTIDSEPFCWIDVQLPVFRGSSEALIEISDGLGPALRGLFS